MKNLINEEPLDYSLGLVGRAKYVCDWTNSELLDSKKILNIGSGFGWYELFLKKYTKAEFICGIDLGADKLNDAISFKDCDNVKFFSGTGLCLPFDADFFDVCVSSEVLEHIPKNQEQVFFDEVSRVLKPGGCFYLTTPADNLMAKITDPAWYLIGHRHYSIYSLKEYGCKSELQLCSYFIKGRWWDLAYIYNLYIAKWIFRRKIFFSKIFEKNLNLEYNHKVNNKNFMTYFCKFKKSL